MPEARSRRALASGAPRRRPSEAVVAHPTGLEQLGGDPVIRKAVFPVAGLGTRMLPATKVLPKEMLPVVDKPIIQYAFEEARAAGVEQFIFVTGRGKSVIEDHFDRAFELVDTLRRKDKTERARSVSAWRADGRASSVYTRQQEPSGLGHAVWCARHLVGDEPFAVMLVDDLIDERRALPRADGRGARRDRRQHRGGRGGAARAHRPLRRARPGRRRRPAGRGQGHGREARARPRRPRGSR